MVGNVEHGSIENQQFFKNISEKSNSENIYIIYVDINTIKT